MQIGSHRSSLSQVHSNIAILSTQIRSWPRDGFLISTDPALVSLEALNDAFDSDQLYWAKRLPLEELKVMVDNSVCLGVYTQQTGDSPRSMIGFARIITDRVTMAYLSDVYILPEYQNIGLGSWLMDCVKEWTDPMPHMRQLVLISREGRNEQYYEKKLSTGRIEESGKGYRFFSRIGPEST